MKRQVPVQVSAQVIVFWREEVHSLWFSVPEPLQKHKFRGNETSV